MFVIFQVLLYLSQVLFIAWKYATPNWIVKFILSELRYSFQLVVTPHLLLKV